MKEKIIAIIGTGMAPELADLKASQVIILFNQRIVEALRKRPMITDLSEFVNEIFIQL